MTLKRPLIIFALVATVVISVAGLNTSREVNADIEINAPANVVWRVLIDYERYGEWNPFITKISGVAIADSRLAVTIEPPIGGTMNFNLLVQSVKEPHEITWTGQTLMPRVLDGEHYFRIKSISADKSIFSQGERYSGVLLFFSWPVIHWSVTQSFNDMNVALKKRAETDK